MAIVTWDRAYIGLGQLVEEARGLRSVDGENPEYDRALVELVMAVGGMPSENREEVAKTILNDDTPVTPRSTDPTDRSLTVHTERDTMQLPARNGDLVHVSDADGVPIFGASVHDARIEVGHWSAEGEWTVGFTVEPPEPAPQNWLVNTPSY